MGNPYLNYAGVLERNQYVHFYLRDDDPQPVGYQLWAGPTPNELYGNPAGSGVGGGGAMPLLEVARGGYFRSPSVLRAKTGLVDGEVHRGTTHMVVNIEDYLVPGMGAPSNPNESWLFFSVQENRNGVGLLTVPGPLPVLGPIYCVPPARTYGMRQPAFTLTGTAPSAVVGVAAGAVPPFDEDLTTAAPRPMYLVFPAPLSEFTLRNDDLANTLLVSFGPGQLMQAVAPGGVVQLYSGSTKEMVLACPNAGGCPFSLYGVLGWGA